MSEEQDRRKYMRVDVQMKARLDSGKFAFVEGTCENISAKGIYMVCDAKPPLGSACELHIQLGDPRLHPIMKFKGSVVRKDKRGVGVLLTGMDFRHYDMLKNIIVFSSLDPDIAEKEFQKFLDLERL